MEENHRHSKSNTLKETVLGLICELCLTLAVIVALYIFWMLFWSGITAQNAQAEAVAKAHFIQPDDSKKPAPEYRDKWPEVGKTPEGDIKGQVYIPVLGNDYWRTLFEGTSIELLNTMGFGHYINSAEPGGIGNFSAAAHRNGYGASLANIESINTGDALIIRTYEYWFVYKTTNHEIVTPDNTLGILPVPYQPGAYPTERLITFTTCHPQYSSEQRYILHGTLDYWAKVKEGVPKELLAVGAKVG